LAEQFRKKQFNKIPLLPIAHSVKKMLFGDDKYSRNAASGKILNKEPWMLKRIKSID
jgi:hypothetical protein